MARKNKNQMQYKKIRKGYFSSSVFIALVIVLFTICSGILLLSMAFSSIIDTRLLGEYQALFSLKMVYEQLGETGLGREKGREVLDASGREFILLDSEGNLIHQHGENTCVMEKKSTLDIYGEELEVYPDSESIILQFTEDGEAEIDLILVIKDLWRQIRSFGDSGGALNVFNVSFQEGFQEGFDGTEPDSRSTSFDLYLYYPDDEEKEREIIDSVSMEMIREWSKKMASYSLWFPMEVNGGEETLIGKVDFYFNLDEILTLLIWVELVEVVLVVLLIALIINKIRNLLRQRQIINLYFTDPATGGHNWMWFVLRGEQYLRLSANAAKSFAVVEILFVKYRNYCVCHSVQDGEDILCKMHDVIRKKVDKREMCAHVTSDTFALLLRYDNEEELRKRIRDLVEALENMDGTHKFAFHVGVNLLPIQRNEKGRAIRRKRLNLETEYNNASTATATLDDSDDSRIAYFDGKMVEEQKWLDMVTERQKGAVEREEFKVYYQPKYDPQEHKLCGAEALIRWDSPELGFISPGRFIPIFEKNGFITEIDHYMISHVARDQKAWLEQGLPCVPVSVNVSRAHFIEKDLASQICHMVDEVGTPHHLIEIELTESAFFDDKNAMIDTIKRLKEYGFSVSMDDFGSGYSSLNSLKDMPLDVLKLDAEFFRGENAGERGEIVVSEAIKLAKSLKMRTVAEGVEEQSQVKFLADMGCDMIQGFYFAKPMPKEDYMERIRVGYAQVDEEEA